MHTGCDRVNGSQMCVCVCTPRAYTRVIVVTFANVVLATAVAIYTLQCIKSAPRILLTRKSDHSPQPSVANKLHLILAHIELRVIVVHSEALSIRG